MTNALIPYSFIPGTKAKASEVNANFLSLAEKINSNNTNILEQINSLDTQVTQDITDATSVLAKCDLSNSNLISNTIISAPNGVAEYDVSTVTIKKGVKALIPNGKNDDGTLKSIEIETEEALSQVQTTSNLEYVLFLCDKTENVAGIASVLKRSFYYQEKAPLNITTADLPVWYKPSENKYYKLSGSGTWEPYLAVPVASFVVGANTVISSVTPFCNTNLLKTSDNLGIMEWIMPDYSSTVGRTIGQTYIAECNGYVFFRLGASSTVKAAQFFVNGVEYYYAAPPVNAEWVSGCIAVSKGDKYQSSEFTVNGSWVKFVPMKGVKNA